MNVRVLFFGATADAAGQRSVEMPVKSGIEARSVFNEVLNKFPQLQHHKLLFAVNQEYVSGDRTIGDGDELAIFTAVSGG